MDNFAYLEPHAICLAVEPVLIWLLITFNAGIALAYFAIPLALLYYIRFVPSTLVYLFAAFIFGCGMSHVMQIVTMYLGGLSYWIEMAVCGATFIVSLCTAMLLVTQGPAIIAFQTRK